MAHITEFTLHGLLGSSTPVHIKLEPDVNIFFGENGSGKTTLLKILDAALSLDGVAMYHLPIEKAEVSIYSLDEDAILDLIWDRKKEVYTSTSDLFDDSYSLHGINAARRLKAKNLPQWRYNETIPASEPDFWTHIFLPTTRLYIDNPSSPTDNKGKGEAELDEQFARSINQSWLQYYSKIITEVRNIQEDGLTSVLTYALAENLEETVGPILDPSTAYDSASKFLNRRVGTDLSILGTRESFIHRYESEEKLRRLVDNLNSVEERIEESMRPHLKFVDTISRFFSNEKNISLTGNDLKIKLASGQLISPSALSSGEKHLLKLLLSAMRADQNSIIIDEPELSLHIDWQKKLVDTIKMLSPQCQLILASHSPEIMADVPDRNIFRI